MKPIRLQLAGFTSYRDPVEIDFTDLDLVCISGSNGAGKSSLLDAMTYALFGQARKRDEAIINSASQKAEVTLDFEYEKQLYRVERSITRGKGGSLDFFIQVPESADQPARWKTLSGRTITETNAAIVDTLRLDYETFVNASFFLQGKADMFATQRPAERKKILVNILGLDQWEAYRQRTADIIKEKTSDVKMCDANLQQVQEELDKEPQHKQTLALVQAQLHAASAEVAQAEASLLAQRAVEQQIKEQERIVAMLKGQVDAAEAELDESVSKHRSRKGELAGLSAELERADAIEANYQAYLELRKQLAEQDKLAERVQPLEADQQDLLRALHGEQEALNKELRYLKAEKAELDVKLETLRNLESKGQDLQSQIEALQDLPEKRAALEHAIQDLQSQKAQKEAERGVIQKKGGELSDRLKKILEAEGASCPVCGQSLQAEHKQRIEADLTQERDSLRAQYSALQKEEAEIVASLDAQRKERDTVLRQERELQNLQRESDQTNSSIAQIRVSEKAWHEKKAARLAEVERLLQDERFLPEVREKLGQIKQNLVQIGYDRQTHSQMRAEVAAAETAQEEHNALELAKNSFGQVKTAVEELAATITRQEQTLQSRTEAYQNAVSRLTEAREGLPEIAISESQMVALKETAAGYQRQLGAVNQNLRNLDVQRERKAQLRAEKEGLQAEIAQLRILERSFGKDGVPAMLIEQVLPELEDKANAILERLSNYTMSVQFSTQRSYKDARREDKRETLDILISDGASTRDYETYSGGEAFRVNFAIRLALSRLLAQRAGAKLRTLVIDEGFGNQDAEGRFRLVEAINMIQDDFDRILVITHIDELKDRFPCRIEVEKQGGGSKVTVFRG